MTQQDEIITKEAVSTDMTSSFSVVSAGNQEAVNTESYQITESTQTSFFSVSSEDGFVGAYSTDGMSSSTLNSLKKL